MKRAIMTAVIAALCLGGTAFAGETPAPKDAKVFFENLEDGATVTSPVTVAFGLSGMEVAPAGTEKEHSGHHHLFIDRAPFGEDDVDLAIPVDANHMHFGKGQTEMSLNLPQGQHTLQLVLGDHEHFPHDPPVASDRITITVK